MAVFHLIVTLLMTLAVAVPVLAVDPPATQPAMVDKLCSAVESLSSLAMTVQVRQEEEGQHIDTSRPPGNRSVRIEVLMAEGGRFREEAYEAGVLFAALVSDGKTLTEYDAKQQRWTRYPLSWRGRYDVNGLLLVKDQRLAWCDESWVDDDSPYSWWLTGVFQKANWKVGDGDTENIDGKKCYVFSAEKRMANGPATLTYTASLAFDCATYLPVRMETLISVSLENGLVIAKSADRYSYDNVRANAEVASGAFQFGAPAEAQLVDAESLRPKPSPLVGHAVPDVEFGMTDGTKVALSQYRGKAAVLLVFWATWCLPCKEELAVLPKLRGEFPEQELPIIAVNSDRDGRTACGFLKKHPLPFPVALDSNNEVGSRFHVKALPTTVLLDMNGTVVETWTGWGGADGLDKIRTVLRSLRKTTDEHENRQP
ncbi:MAG: redoxin domain-containing protein [Phycisphaerae bacterium]|nr:redoxin domain-containing protein [Phycisphaerae bacterium]